MQANGLAKAHMSVGVPDADFVYAALRSESFASELSSLRLRCLGRKVQSEAYKVREFCNLRSRQRQVVGAIGFEPT